jgi:hypothetical protein
MWNQLGVRPWNIYKKSGFFLFLVVSDNRIVPWEPQNSKDINDKMDLV